MNEAVANVPTGIRISPDAVRLDIEAADAAAAIRAVGAPLVAAGHVTADYVAAAIDREAAFPTGLPTVPEPVAVPHADPEGVVVPSIALGRLRTPVEFTEMASADRRLPVRLVFLLALQSKDEAAVLSRLIRGFQDATLLAFLLESGSAESIAERIQALLSDADG